MWSAIKPIFTARFLKFAAVGSSGVLVNLGVLALLSDLVGLHDNLASALAILVSISSNFAVNECWTFADRKREGAADIVRRWLKFHAISLVGASVQFCIFVSGNLTFALLLGDPSSDLSETATHGVLGPILEPPEVGAWKYLSQLGGIAAATLWNFLANFYWTWAGKAPCDKL